MVGSRRVESDEHDIQALPGHQRRLGRPAATEDREDQDQAEYRLYLDCHFAPECG
jgi:hypothetical protein